MNPGIRILPVLSAKGSSERASGKLLVLGMGNYP